MENTNLKINIEEIELAVNYDISAYKRKLERELKKVIKMPHPKAKKAIRKGRH